MKFDVKNRWTGKVQFTAEINCAENARVEVKLGLAALWAVKNGASLDGASLDGASLDGASLRRASLDGASLDGASLRFANLDGANLDGASLDGASLRRASLRRANLDGANLDGANLDGASLDGANLDGTNLDGASLHFASLRFASLRRANLDGANLDGANLYSATGVNDHIKCIQVDQYPVAYTAEVIQIGCQRHTHQEWAAFSDAQIRAMDGVKALKWWRKYKDWLFQTIALCPAKSTQYVAEKST